ncbi:sulfatase family protein [Kiritimatiella glycovorans]|uniref:Arylsulfatase n=1 Tax=Kiritimatiella glycovorans TaxID=1307763 RepID=A0A0G3EC08_9BACT|nr:arylsulfatase [Kiritimatiella glycovorans]AKJ63808.1 Arylsulfatase [Kiritimatiella glycovorans]
MKKFWMTTLLIGMTTLLGRAAGRERPNILLILADDLGYGNVDCYNPGPSIPTPHLDRLSREGRRFMQAYAPAAVCTPTRYGILTGQYPWRGPLKDGVVMEYEHPIVAPELITLPERLKTAGYATACIGKWHLGMTWPTVDGEPLRTDFSKRPSYDAFVELAKRIDYKGEVRSGPVDHGFDYYYGEGVINFPPYMFIENDRFAEKPAGLRLKGLSGAPGMMSADYTDESVLARQSDAVLEYLDRRAKGGRETPFFLYWAPNAIHYPICPSADFRGKTEHGPYGDFMYELDAAVGRVVDRIDELDLRENTLIVFTSDNGPRRPRLPTGHDCTAGLRGRKASDYDGGVKVPFIASWPGTIPTNTASDAVISLVDLYPTFTKLGGAECTNQFTDGIDVREALVEGTLANSDERAIVMTSVRGKFALRRGKWSLLSHPGNGIKRYDGDEDTPTQLYDLHEDRGQRNNLFPEFPEKARELERDLKRVRALE